MDEYEEGMRAYRSNLVASKASQPTPWTHEEPLQTKLWWVMMDRGMYPEYLLTLHQAKVKAEEILDGYQEAWRRADSLEKEESAHVSRRTPHPGGYPEPLRTAVLSAMLNRDWAVFL